MIPRRPAFLRDRREVSAAFAPQQCGTCDGSGFIRVYRKDWQTHWPQTCAAPCPECAKRDAELARAGGAERLHRIAVRLALVAVALGAAAVVALAFYYFKLKS